MLSPTQEAINRYVRQYRDVHPYSPTMAEIAHGCGISSTSVVSYNLRKLEREGLLRVHRGIARGIEVTS